MKFRPTLLLFAFLIWAAPAFAKKPAEFSDDRIITSVDPDHSTITISIHGTEKIYQTAMVAEFIVNGANASIRDLAPDMKVTSLSLSDPDTISEIQASGSTPGAAKSMSEPPVPAAETLPPPPAVPASPAESAEMVSKLGGTYWQFPNDTPLKAWMYLAPDGMAVLGWSQRVGVWKVVGHMKIEYIIPRTKLSGPAYDSVLRVNSQFTTMGDATRIDQPRPEMVKRAEGMAKDARRDAAPAPAPPSP